MRLQTTVLLSLLALPALAQTATPAERTAAKSIDAAALRGHTRFLAHDLLEGRGPATRGDALTQAYIAAQFEALGLKPGAPDGTWLQPFDIVGVEGHPEKLQVAAPGKGSLELAFSKDFVAYAGRQQPRSELARSELVFVGYGIVAPEYGWDDFKGVDLKGKTLVILNSDPEDDPKLFAGRTRLYYGRWDYKYEQAARLGAAGAVIIHTPASAGYDWNVIQSSWSGEQFSLPDTGAPQLDVRAWVTEEAARRLVALGGQDLDALRRAAQRKDFRPVPLGAHASTSFTNRVERKRTANVLGLLEGSDPKLSAEVVLYSAHHDHLGVAADAKPGTDAIHNGAVDNASGVAAVLAIARAFRALPRAPARSILFAAVAGEEQGLLGSEHLAEHLPVPTGRVAANVNVDGANIWGRTRDVTAIGLGKSTLDGPLAGLARLQGRRVRPDELSDRGFFYRSDQFAFAKRGIPAAYFGSGMDFIGRPAGWGREQREAWEKAHYHQPSDELREDWDLSGAVEDAQLAFLLGAHVARTPRLPAWNPGDEFEAARKASLEALKKEAKR